MRVEPGGSAAQEECRATGDVYHSAVQSVSRDLTAADPFLQWCRIDTVLTQVRVHQYDGDRGTAFGRVVDGPTFMACQMCAYPVPQLFVVGDHRSTISAVVHGRSFESRWLYRWAYRAGVVVMPG